MIQETQQQGLCGNAARGLVFHPGVFWDFGLDNELDRHLTHFEPMQRRQNETITASTQFISELVPAHKFGTEVMSVRETTRIRRGLRDYAIG